MWGLWSSAAAAETKVKEEATDRSVQLLRSWLSPPQLAQFERDQTFEVVGGETGARYRIEKGAVYNIYALGEGGKVAEVLCCVPLIPDAANPYYAHPMPVGDVMLAQKVALETDELGVLGIANRRVTFEQSNIAAPPSEAAWANAGYR